MHTTQYNKLSEDSKERVKILNKPKIISLDSDKDDLPPMTPLEGDEEVKLEQEETIVERVKLNPGKRKKQEQD